MLKRLVIGLGLLVGLASGANAQTACSLLPLTSLLLPLADNVPSGSITPRNIRDAICSQWNQQVLLGATTLTGTELVSISKGGNPFAVTAQQIANLAPNSGSSGAVASVFGRTGAIVAQTGDYAASQVGALAITQNLSDLGNGSTAATNLLNNLCSTQGSVLFRGISVWQCLGPGTNGQVLTTAGGGANPSWSSAIGTVSSVFGRTGTVVASSGDYSFSLLTGQNTLAQLPTMAANTVLANTTNGSTTPSASTWPSCTDLGGNHLNYTNGVGLTCGNSGGAGGGVATVTSNSPGLTASPTTGNVALTLLTPVRNNTGDRKSVV